MAQGYVCVVGWLPLPGYIECGDSTQNARPLYLSLSLSFYILPSIRALYANDIAPPPPPPNAILTKSNDYLAKKLEQELLNASECAKE